MDEKRIVDNVRFYDEHAAAWARKNSSRTVPARDRFIELLRERGAHTALDAGCGPARDLLVLLRAGFNAYGIDAALGMVEEAHRRLREARIDLLPESTTHGRVEPEERVMLGRIEAMPYVPGYFDAVLGLASYLHLPRETMPQALEQTARVLKSGGLFAIEVKRGAGTLEKPYESRGHAYTRTYQLYEHGELEAVLEPRFSILESMTVPTDPNSSDGLDWLVVFAEKR